MEKWRVAVIFKVRVVLAKTNLQSILKRRDITLPANVHIVKAIVFTVVRFRCESSTIKRLSAEKLMLSNHGAGEHSRESLGQQGDQTSQS